MARRGRKLTGEEEALWRKVAETLTPHRRTPPQMETAPPPPVPDPKPVRIPRTLKPLGRPEPAISGPAPAPAPPSGLDKRTEQRLRQGKRKPDARLDLHGMTADRAHHALNSFIADSRARGLRMVLVITGKGGAGAPRDFGDPAPGVLRREVPVWLRTPPLAAQVVNVTPSHVRHGGGGALYVYLKKLR